MATPVGFSFSVLRSSGSWAVAPGQSHAEMKTSAREPKRRFLLISNRFVFVAALRIGNCSYVAGYIYYAASHP